MLKDKVTKIKRKSMLRLAFPLLLFNTLQCLLIFSDNFFSARISSTVLAASSLFSLVYLCITAIANGISIASQTLISSRIGRTSPHVSSYTISSFIVTFSFAIPLFFLVKTLLFDISSILSSDQEIQKIIYNYLDSRIYGIFPLFTFAVVKAFLISYKKTIFIFISGGISVFCNCGLNAIVVYSDISFFDKISFLALSSCLSEFIGLIPLLFCLNKIKKKEISLRIIKKASMRSAKNSILIASQNFLSIITWLFFFFRIGAFGIEGLAVANVMRVIMVIMFIPINTFSYCTNTLVAESTGKSEISLSKIINEGIKWTLYSCCFISIIIILLWQDIMTLFGIQSFEYSSVYTGFLVLCSCLVAAISSNYQYALLAIDETKKATFILLVTSLLYVLYIEFTYQCHLKYSFFGGCEYLYWIIIGLMSFSSIKKSKIFIICKTCSKEWFR